MRQPFEYSSVRESEARVGVSLGPLERDVMEVMWKMGEANVRDVVQKIERDLAYTTVMTTLDRLYKKGVLDRVTSERAFVYSPRFSRQDWDRQRAGEMMSGFLAGSLESRETILSCLVDAVGSHDASLLDELELKIQRKREALSKTSE
jgi:predicted transcriptional regulator